ncbi:MAG: hypothetical protein Q8O88_06145 [bacterium]|nr:hypothetical protein [bacterium]
MRKCSTCIQWRKCFSPVYGKSGDDQRYGVVYELNRRSQIDCTTRDKIRTQEDECKTPYNGPGGDSRASLVTANRFGYSSR